MGELVDLEEFRKAKEEKEIEELQRQVGEIIKNLPEENYIPIFSEDEFRYFSCPYLEWPLSLDGYGHQFNHTEELDFEWEKD
ncbi:hypothetical protein CL634_10295 [bacterium]|nr:hypothetical protein [bacterium]|tara:strand:- start:317 stop:562 length:246 start_codon:yes stop_codon:yes gene_type:complete